MLASSMLISGYPGNMLTPVKVHAAGNFTLNMATKAALANNKTYKKTKAQIETQQMKYVDAVTSIQKRKKSLSSFRWSPLLSFKFPQDPKMDDEYTWTYKPLQIQTNITNLRHKLSDVVYASKEEVSALYVDIYVSDVKIEFLKDVIAGLERDKERTTARIAEGTGNPNDIRKIDNSLKKYKSALAKEERASRINKGKMMKFTGLDVSTGYTFTNPFVTAEIPRNSLDKLIKVAKERDHDFYVQKMTTSLALTSLKLNHQLMKSQYGHKLDQLSPYINQAYKGMEIDTNAFQKATNAFIEAVDKKWKGKRRILFFSFTLEWFMGDTDGSRYIEDNPYALATSAGEYLDALEDQKTAEAELESSIKNDFENIVTARNAYLNMYETNAELYETIQKDKVRNIAGDFPLDELTDEQSELAANGLDEIDLLAAYTKLLFSFDRKTCGGITEYLASAKADVKSSSGGNSYKTPGTEKDSGDDGYVDSEDKDPTSDFVTDSNGGDSYLEADKIKGAYYYIETHIEDRMFTFGVSIPEDTKPKITHYELWVNDTRIGERTAVGDEIRHLTLALDNADKTSVKMFSSGKLVDICEIDSSVTRAELKLTSSYKVIREEAPRTVAAYKSSISDSPAKVTLEFTREEGEKIGFYVVTDEDGNALLSGDHYKIDEPFSYLAAIAGDFSKLKVQFYDSSDEFLYTGNFNTSKKTIVINTQ
ncbi:MAG: hypothetical protein K6G84_07120 [Lachnospiraceae bacterium]|nr:hypothetical protein [Lachnospiraceae bacterium]